MEATEPVKDSVKDSGISACGAAFLGLRPFFIGALAGAGAGGSGTASVKDCAGASSRIEELFGLRPLFAGGALGGIEIIDNASPPGAESITEAMVSSAPEAFFALRPRFVGAAEVATDIMEALVASGKDAIIESAMVSSCGAGGALSVDFAAPFLFRVVFFDTALAVEDLVDALLPRVAFGFCVCVG